MPIRSGVVKRLQLENVEFEGDNNTYLLEGDGETAFIDTGIATPATREELECGLGEQGVGFADIDVVFLTHWHADHAGLAGHVQSKSGAEVLVHELDAALVRQEEDAWNGMQELQQRYFDEWGMPEEDQEELTSFLMGANMVTGEPPEITEFTDGDVFDVAGVELEVMHAPGHTSGLSCFVCESEEGEEVYSGDALLPVYTPNVGGADVRTEHPLEQYLDSLDRFVERDFGVAWPGHRGGIREPSARAVEIITHHRQRSRKIIGVLEEGGELDAWTVGQNLFGELESIHIMHGPGESYAHLEHMERRGVVESVGEEPVRYRLLEDRPGLEEWFSLERY